MKFKVGDKVRNKGGTPFCNGQYVVTIREYSKHGYPYFVETGTWTQEHRLELAEEEKEMTHEYEEGKWYMWGGGECPLHPKDHVETRVFDVNTGRLTPYASNVAGSAWKHMYNIRVFAFKITKKYVPPVTKEMTIEEISKALGYDVKIVKG